MMVKEEEIGEEHHVLVEFGAACSFTSENTNYMYSTVVTPGFTPIEQYSRKNRQSPYSGVFALCATVYYMLTGQIPTSVLERICGIPLKTFRDNGVQVSAQIEKAIMHRLALKSDDRIQTMQ